MSKNCRTLSAPFTINQIIASHLADIEQSLAPEKLTPEVRAEFEKSFTDSLSGPGPFLLVGQTFSTFKHSDGSFSHPPVNIVESDGGNLILELS
ncbi:hypothetical protein [Granulicella sp. dw_53]|uniref:hypothetical protein n=1 Tax=Granulicella sp. dw_53 TaxID=2719792 RepID=UPI001BD307F1|nr:hypothetical protein [Granulicella sp. dw_53]